MVRDNHLKTICVFITTPRNALELVTSVMTGRSNTVCNTHEQVTRGTSATENNLIYVQQMHKNIAGDQGDFAWLILLLLLPAARVHCKLDSEGPDCRMKAAWPNTL
jgi:hypothetical protein